MKYLQLFEERLESLRQLAELGLLSETDLKILEYIEAGSQGSLSLKWRDDLVEIPDALKRVGGALDLSECASLERLPDGLEVEKFLDLNHCTRLKRLPMGLRVGRSLVLIGCTGLRSLPDDLEVGGDIWLFGSGVQSVPDGIRLGGTVNGLGD